MNEIGIDKKLQKRGIGGKSLRFKTEIANNLNQSVYQLTVVNELQA